MINVFISLRKRSGCKNEGKEKKKKVFKAWTGYRFDVLNGLQDQGLIWQIPGGKTLFLTEKGKQEALELKGNYLG